MPNFHMRKQVRHSAQKMFALVADIERYPEFLPMCKALTISSRRERDGNTLLAADMTVGYKLIREVFTTQVYLRPYAGRIDVQYIDGPFKHLENRWQFLPVNEPEQAGKAASPDGDADRDYKKREAVEKAVAQLGIGQNTAAGHATLPRKNRKSEKNKMVAAAGVTEACLVDFYIDYSFKNPLLSALMGTMFDIAFRKFTEAFETRADAIYGISE